MPVTLTFTERYTTTSITTEEKKELHTHTHNKSDSTLIELRYKWNSMDKVLIYLHCILYFFMPLVSLSQYILYCNLFSQFVAICSGYCWLLLLVHSLALFLSVFSFIFFSFLLFQFRFVFALHCWMNQQS